MIHLIEFVVYLKILFSVTDFRQILIKIEISSFEDSMIDHEEVISQPRPDNQGQGEWGHGREPVEGGIGIKVKGEGALSTDETFWLTISLIRTVQC